jgi:dTDP-glucose 4,6-dehydratase
MTYDKTILITGGAGFIGSHVVRQFVNKYSNYLIINLDALTYAGNLENIKDIENKNNYIFVKGDITDIKFLYNLFDNYNITDVIHLAAESHVDRSITNPLSFVMTNIIGTVNLLTIAKEYWIDDYSLHRFHHVSTDEVYGTLDLNPNNKFTENTPYSPHSPYSASKASSDHFVKAYHDTYGLNITISNCSNNYGPNQFPEKLIPLVIYKLIHKQSIPVYGTGENIRDWLYVKDHANAIDIIFHHGNTGETYNIGGNQEKTNIEIINEIIKCYCDETHTDIETYNKLITFVNDRKGHDLRYAIDSSKISNELNWKPSLNFNEGIHKTVKWYLDNINWIDDIISGEYQNINNRFE